MYSKNLKEDLRLRLSTRDMEFLRKLSEERAVSISECIRSIIAEYRRSVEVINALNSVIKYQDSQEREGELSNGDTETNIDDKL